jgi:small-conductance mechanosensitive channel
MFQRDFNNLLNQVMIGLGFYGVFELLVWAGDEASWPRILIPYAGFIALWWGGVVLVKVVRIIAFEYLFFFSMRTGVPLLLVNVISIVLSMILMGWVLTVFFTIQVTSLLATSAVLSIVLGLALQDTLGNLFAGIALQFDKAFEIGDWVELKNGSEKVVGQVYEISWRATVLLAITDEVITIPNKSLGQWQISNFAGRDRPFYRSHILRFPYGTPVEKTRDLLMEATKSVKGILQDPPPVVIIGDLTENWFTMRVIYAMYNYGAQWNIADEYFAKAMVDLERAGIDLAPPRLLLESPTQSN